MASSSVGKTPNTNSSSCDAEDDCQMLQNPSFMIKIDVDKIIEPQTKRSKTLTSHVWNYFVKIGVGKDGKEKQMQGLWELIYLCK